MARALEYQHIGLSGIATGTIKFDDSLIEWKGPGGGKKYDPEQVERAEWVVYGTKGHLFLNFKDGKIANMDGFSKGDYGTLSQWFETHYNVAIQEISVRALLTHHPHVLTSPLSLCMCLFLQAASDGGNFGDIDLEGSSMFLKSAQTGKRVFELKLNNVSQCVLPGNSKDEVEIQFHETDTADKEEDMLVHVRLRFPTLPDKGEGEDEEEEEGAEGAGGGGMTPAESFQKSIMEQGMIRSVTGNVIAEFTQDQGTFVTPRGRYAIQVAPSPLLLSPLSLPR
jgi:hypothetical protein